MKFLATIRYINLAALLLTSNLVFAAENFNTQLLKIQQQWAKVNYQLEGDLQEQQFDALLSQAKKFVTVYPQKAEAHIWLGIIQSSYAGAKGGLGALSLVKDAKKSLEYAIKIDDSALEGSAYTSLGTLYHKVPGWPLAFGDDDDAETMLEKAISINPQGIDANYFYGEFLFDKKDYARAKLHLNSALTAAPRADRALADKSRRAEITQLLAKVDAKLQEK